MSFRAHQLAELLGIVLLIGATAVQLFYLEPVKRAIEWRQVVFTQQENAHVLAETVFDNRIAILKAMKVAPPDIETAEAERKKLIDRYDTALTNVANIVLDKEPVEAILQWIVIAMFIIGTLLTTFGPIAELRAANRKH